MTLEQNGIWGYVARFCTVGMAATIVYFVAANILIYLEVAESAVCSIAAYFLGMIVSYAGQSGYTFRVTHHNSGQIIRFCFLSILGLCISFYSVSYSVSVLYIDPIWGTLFTSVSIPIISFFIMKVWVFKK